MSCGKSRWLLNLALFLFQKVVTWNSFTSRLSNKTCWQGRKYHTAPTTSRPPKSIMASNSKWTPTTSTWTTRLWRLWKRLPIQLERRAKMHQTRSTQLTRCTLLTNFPKANRKCRWTTPGGAILRIQIGLGLWASALGQRRARRSTRLSTDPRLFMARSTTLRSRHLWIRQPQKILMIQENSSNL